MMKLCRQGGWSLAASFRVLREDSYVQLAEVLACAIAPRFISNLSQHVAPAAATLESAAADMVFLAHKDDLVRVWCPTERIAADEGVRLHGAPQNSIRSNTQHVSCPVAVDKDSKMSGPVMFHGLGDLPPSVYGGQTLDEARLQEIRRCVFRVRRAEFGGAFFTPSFRLAHSFAVPSDRETHDSSVLPRATTSRLVLVVQLTEPLSKRHLVHPDTDARVGSVVDSVQGDWRQVYRRLESSDPLHRRVDGYVSLAEETVPVYCFRGDAVDLSGPGNEAAAAQSLEQLLRIAALIEMR